MPLDLRRDVERRVPDDGSLLVFSAREEHELLFAEVYGHGALQRFEAPRQIGRDVAVELNRHGLRGDGRRSESTLCVVPP